MRKEAGRDGYRGHGGPYDLQQMARLPGSEAASHSLATCLQQMAPQACRNQRGSWRAARNQNLNPLDGRPSISTCSPPPSPGRCAMAYNEVVLDSWQGGGWDKAAMVGALGLSRGGQCGGLNTTPRLALPRPPPSSTSCDLSRAAPVVCGGAQRARRRCDWRARCTRPP